MLVTCASTELTALHRRSLRCGLSRLVLAYSTSNICIWVGYIPTYDTFCDGKIAYCHDGGFGGELGARRLIGSATVLTLISPR